MSVRTIVLASLLLAASEGRAAFELGPYQLYPTAGQNPDAVAVGDINGDGLDDVVLTTIEGHDTGQYSIYLYLQQPGGVLAAPVIYANNGITYQTGIAIGDLNNDGIDDAVIGDDQGLSVVRLGRRSPRKLGIQRLADGQTWRGVGLADTDGNGTLDVVASRDSTNVLVYPGDANGGVSTPRTAPVDGGNFKLADMDRDGKPDLVKTSAKARIYFNDGLGAFRANPFEVDPGYSMQSVFGVATGDFNHDGRMDIASSANSNSEPVAIMLQQEGGAFAPALHQEFDHASTPSILGADLNGDGRDDLLVHDIGWYLVVHLQDADGTLDSGTSIRLPWSNWNVNAYAMDVGDVNGDGCLDVVIASADSGLVTLAGSGCEAVRTDLALEATLTRTVATISLFNDGTRPIESPLVVIELSAGSGALQTGDLPVGCVLQGQTSRLHRIECLPGTMAAHDSKTLTIPLEVSGTGARNTLTLAANATTDTPERSLINNRAWKHMTTTPGQIMKKMPVRSKRPAAVR